jgi:DNA repair protein RadC
MTTMIKLTDYERSPKLSELKVTYRRNGPTAARRTISQALDAAEYLKSIWDRDRIELVEEFVMLCLDRSHQPLGWLKVSTGGLFAVTVDIRVVLSVALQTASSALIVAHNHPSGNLTPSPEDLALTRRLKEASALVGIKLLDHIILTKDSALSFVDQEYL